MHERNAFSHDKRWLLSADNAIMMFVFFQIFFSSPFLLTFWLANVSCCIYRVQYRLAIKYVFAPNKKRYVSSASIFSSVSLFSLSCIIRSITVNIDVFFLLWLVSHNYIYFELYPYSCHHYICLQTHWKGIK